MKHVFLCVASCLVVPGWSSAQLPPRVRDGDTASIARRIAAVERTLLPPVTIAGQPAAMNLASRMAFYNVPGVSIAVINDGRVQWARAYGVKDVRTLEPVTTETLFQAASISKPVTAVAVLRLVREGRLALDVDLNSLLSSWRIPDNEYTATRKVTLRDVLSHRSGLTNSIGAYASGELHLPSLIEALDGASPLKPRPVRVEFVPGTRMEYSGGAFTVLQVLLTDVTGMAFHDHMREAVLAPLRMLHSFFFQPLPAELSAFAATAHGPDGQPHPGGWRVLNEAAAGGLWSTPSDLARFVVELQHAASGRSDRILDSTLTARMLAPQEGRWGLGIALQGEGRARHFSHIGWNRGGYRALIIGFLETGQGTVIMTNGESRGTELIAEVVRAIAQEYDWPAYRSRERTLGTAESARYSEYVGRYQLEPGAQLVITAEHARLFIAGGPFGTRRVELHPQSVDAYFVLESDVALTFRRDSWGHVSEMVVQPPGQPRVAMKLDEGQEEAW
jgi:CubicO group peptidase (beta-lactamase class C family)